MVEDKKRRIGYLDGLRGIAILSVAAGHFIGLGNAPYLPYGDRFAHNIVGGNSWIGVQLFFLISGYVIFMTLERCSGFGSFIKRRWLRLFPAMLITTIAILFAGKIAQLPGPISHVRWLDALPGLSFISPSFWHVILRLPIDSLDGPFWTLYTEMAFYVIFGLCYFRFGEKRAILLLILIALAVRTAPVLFAAVHAPSAIQRLVEPFQWIRLDMLGWFASGALFYRAANGEPRWFLPAILVGLLAMATLTATVGVSIENRLVLTGAVLLFAVAQRWEGLQRVLGSRPLLFVGFVSYPLYLIHESFGLAFMPIFARWVDPVAAALLAFAVVFFMAWVMARFLEPVVRNRIAALMGRPKVSSIAW